jgi:hypothetical protein
LWNQLPICREQRQQLSLLGIESDRADDYSGHPAVARCRKLIRGRRWLMVDAVFVAAEVEMDVIDMVAIGIGIEHFVEIAAGLARHRM